MAQKDDVPKANIGFELLDRLMAVNTLNVAVGLRRKKDTVTPFERNAVQAKVAVLNPNMVRE